MLKAIRMLLDKPDWELNVVEQLLTLWIRQVMLIVGLGIALAPLLAFVALVVWIVTGGK